MVSLALAAVSAGPAFGDTGDLIQGAGTLGCISEDGSPEGDPAVNTCADGFALAGIADIAVSPDGKNAYAAGASAITIFNRDLATGALTQKQGTDGCISNDGSPSGEPAVNACRVGKGISPGGITVSPDGKNVYLAAGGIAIFNRDASTGAVTQDSGTAGCISEDGSPSGDPAVNACADGTGVASARAISVSPDGKSVYAGGANALAILDRNLTTGHLNQLPGAAGCVGTDPGCSPGDLVSLFSVIVSPDNKHVYASNSGPPAMAVVVLERNAASGALTQASVVGIPIVVGIRALAISPDGRHVYGSTSNSPDNVPDGGSALLLFDRNAASGALTQKAGLAGCITQTGNAGHCEVGVALFILFDVAISPDGQNVYALSRGYPGAIAIFDRDSESGLLTQKQDTTGCISDSGHPAGDVNLCVDARGDLGIFNVRSMVVAPDGKNVYIGYPFGSGLLIFDRELAPDADSDGVPDTADRCPAQAGPASNGGCPLSGDGGPGGGGGASGGGASGGPGGGSAQVGRTINGTAGNDRLVGTAGNDVINCGGGDDVVIAGAGNDVINCGPGNDVIDAGAGNDRVSGGSGNDRITGGAGNDRLAGDGGNDRIAGGTGNDTITGGGGNDRLSGNGGNDRLSGGSGKDRLSGGSGKDVLVGGPGVDVLSGGPGKDKQKQ